MINQLQTDQPDSLRQWGNLQLPLPLDIQHLCRKIPVFHLHSGKQELFIIVNDIINIFQHPSTQT